MADTKLVEMTDVTHDDGNIALAVPTCAVQVAIQESHMQEETSVFDPMDLSDTVSPQEENSLPQLHLYSHKRKRSSDSRDHARPQSSVKRTCMFETHADLTGSTQPVGLAASTFAVENSIGNMRLEKAQSGKATNPEDATEMVIEQALGTLKANGLLRRLRGKKKGKGKKEGSTPSAPPEATIGRKQRRRMREAMRDSSLEPELIGLNSASSKIPTEGPG